MKLSIAMITYNHEKYIAQALDSVLMQEVNFDYEIVIGDDLSQDRTREILLGYQEKYPDKIRLLLHEKNLGPGGNIYHVLNSCQGEYIALLEGDDYWTSPKKLQTQVEYLDCHPRCSLCCHYITVYSEYKQKSLGEEQVKGGSNSYSLEDLLNFNYMPRTGASVYRNHLIQLPEWIKQLSNVDLIIFLMLAHEGTIDYIDCCYGVYRVHAGGIWSGRNRSNAYINSLTTKKQLSGYYNHKYDKYDKLFNFQALHAGASRAFYDEGDIESARYHFWCTLSCTRGKISQLKRVAKLFFFLYMHYLYRIGFKLCHFMRARGFQINSG